MKTKKVSTRFIPRLITLLLAMSVVWIPFHNIQAGQIYTNQVVVLVVGENPQADVQATKALTFVDPESPFQRAGPNRAPLCIRTPLYPETDTGWNETLWDEIFLAGFVLADRMTVNAVACAGILVWVAVTILILGVVYIIYKLVRFCQKYLPRAPPPDPGTNSASGSSFSLTATAGSEVDGTETNIYHWDPTNAFTVEFPTVYEESYDLANWVAPLHTIGTFSNSYVTMITYIFGVPVQTNSCQLSVTNDPGGGYAYSVPFTYTNQVDTRQAPVKFFRGVGAEIVRP